MTAPMAELTAEEIKGNAERLGLKWSLRPGTITSPNTGTNLYALVLLDNDTEPTKAYGLTGIVTTGDRVMTVNVDPEGIYIIGYAGAGGPFRARQTLTAAAASVTFTLPSYLRKVTVSWSARSSVAGASTAIRARINNDTSANYHTHMIQAVAAGAAAGSATAAATSWILGVLAGNTATADFFSAGELVLPGWDSPHASLSVLFRNNSISSGGVSDSGGGIYAVTGPYTSVVLFPDGGSNFVTGSDFQVLGW